MAAYKCGGIDPHQFFYRPRSTSSTSLHQTQLEANNLNIIKRGRLDYEHQMLN